MHCVVLHLRAFVVLITEVVVQTVTLGLLGFHDMDLGWVVRSVLCYSLLVWVLYCAFLIGLP